ncbi:putative phosphosugar-binding protein [Bacillus ectoiniformans]|uniref:DUF2529 family protein n=1 Tax=Bacillus ectoiniformans TaxID=1494429 RepID=UPI00195D97F9|nr:DUF2529 family protein [Bacillus ectoiniformans]MBM7648337.1 putative phosphosugar-binding protein [Bacillus ectoiniformans]
MLKMFTTQLTGLLQRISDKEAFSIEDGARLLAQASAGEGHIYIKGLKEMQAIEYEAIEGAEPFRHARVLQSDTQIKQMDRVLLISRLANDPEAIAIGESLAAEGIPFVAIAGQIKADSEPSLADLADIFIDTKLTKGMLPDDSGGRTGFPSAMAGLYIYHLLKMTTDEILEDY